MKYLHIVLTYSMILSLVIVFSMTEKSYEYGCTSDFVPRSDKSVYNMGDIVIVNLHDDNMCPPDDSTISLKIMDVTLYDENPVLLTTISTKFSNDDIKLNFTLPKYLDPCCLHKYTLTVHTDDIGDVQYGGIQFVATENMTNQTRDMELTVLKPVISTGTYEEIMLKICPVPIPEQGRVLIRDPITKLITDPGSIVAVDYYVSNPNGKQTMYEDFISPLTGNCDTNYSAKTILPDSNGTWSVYSVARWVEKNSTQQMQSKTITFLVKEPIIGDKKIERISISKDATMSENTIEMLDWSHDGKLILIHVHPVYSQNGTSYLELLDTGGNVIKKIDVYGMSKVLHTDARILSSGNLAILNEGTGLVLYDIKNDAQDIMIKNADMVAFDLISDGDIVYTERSLDTHDMYHSYTTWLSDSHGKKISRLFTSDHVVSLHANPDVSKIIFVEHNSTNEMDQFSYAMKIYDVQENKTMSLEGHENVDYAKWSPNGQFLVYRTIPSYDGIGIIGLTDDTGSFDETLYEYSNNISSFIISPDGYNIDFSSHESGSDSIGLYQMKFVHPIPEFFLAVPIMLIGIVSTTVFYRLWIRK